MHIYELSHREPAVMERLLAVWEDSVRATHLFLSDAEVKAIREYVPQAVGFYQHMGFAAYKRTDHDEEGNPSPLLYMKRA